MSSVRDKIKYYTRALRVQVWVDWRRTLGVQKLEANPNIFVQLVASLGQKCIAQLF